MSTPYAKNSGVNISGTSNPEVGTATYEYTVSIAFQRENSSQSSSHQGESCGRSEKV